LDPRLEEVMGKIEDEALRRRVSALLENPTIEIEGKVYSGLSLDEAPGGLSRHHSYPRGLIEHMLSSSEIALTLCNVVEKIYHGRVDKDLVLSGVLLHDIFKPLIYSVKKDGTYGVTPLADCLDHLSLIVAELIRRGFPLNLIHVVCAHHGWEAGSIAPRTVEALICHLADVTDSQLNGEVLRAARYLVRDATGEDLRLLASKEAFEIVHSKAAEGWDGVKETIEKIGIVLIQMI